jgi:hypothetical protein
MADFLEVNPKALSDAALQRISFTNSQEMRPIVKAFERAKKNKF